MKMLSPPTVASPNGRAYLLRDTTMKPRPIDAAATTPADARPVRSRRRLLHAMTAACCLLIFHVGCQPAVEPPPAQDPDAGETAESGPVTIRFEWPENEPATTQVVEDVSAGTLLETVLRDLPEPEMEITGEGQTALVQSIGGIGISGERGWTFQINGNFATRGIGSTRLTPPTTITWRYTTFEEASE